MIDRTQEDINQDARIAKLEQSERELRDLVAELQVSRDRHDVSLRHLYPVISLVDYVEEIKKFFERWSK